jgi:dTDP-4-dehydrorhamnose reductase
MIWLVGNRGMLGTEVESILKDGGAPYIATDREVDITHPDAPMEFVNARGPERLEWIINCAAYTAVDLAEDEPEKAFAVNAAGPLHLARATQASGAALLHISTDYVFNGEKVGEYTEEDPPNPLNTYGKSKLQGEQAVRSSLDRHLIIRTAWLYGTKGKNFVDTMLRLFRERREVRVVRDQTGNPTYARDLARVIVTLVSQSRPLYGTYHFTNDGRVSWFEFAVEIYREALARGIVDKGTELVPIAASEFPTRARRPRNSCLSKEKIQRELLVTTRGWRKALGDYLREMEQHHGASA